MRKKLRGKVRNITKILLIAQEEEKVIQDHTQNQELILQELDKDQLNFQCLWEQRQYNYQLED